MATTRPRRGVTPDEFAALALALEGAEQGAHMGATDFRVGGRIFATLASVTEGYGNLLLSPEMQAAFIADAPDLFRPVHGGWGRMGATHLRLAAATRDQAAGALEAAWRLRIEKNAGTRARRPRTRSAPRPPARRRP
ncbi:MAG: MmcQ/YjbR family DNA-binding protein [Vicinamibacterales bacterium]